MQALKNNAEHMPETISLLQNYINGAGQVALLEAVEDIAELYDIHTTIHIR